MLYFFLSYARGDEDDLVHRFFLDLTVEVRVRAGLPRDAEVGFVDSRMKVGARWSNELVDAISRCNVFIALTSPRYFLSEPCGQEWQLFADRSARYESVSGVYPEVLKPLIWVPPIPPHRVHPEAARLQYVSEALGDAYPHFGVRQLLRLQRHRDAYREFLFELAGQIVEAAERYNVPPGSAYVDFDGVSSAFHSPSTSRRSINGARLALPGEALVVHFVVAAPSRAQASTVRSDVSCYGDDATDWAPYRPATPEPLGDYAVGMAAERSIRSQVAALAQLAELADQAIRDNQIIVLLVDVWVTEIDGPLQVLTGYSRRDRAWHDPTTAVLLPGNSDDSESRRNWRGLSDSCRRIFERLADDDELYRSNIRSFEAFQQELPATLEAAVNRTLGAGRVLRQPPREFTRERPTLDIP